MWPDAGSLLKPDDAVQGLAGEPRLGLVAADRGRSPLANSQRYYRDSSSGGFNQSVERVCANADDETDGAP
jgi:hypothetical protein